MSPSDSSKRWLRHQAYREAFEIWRETMSPEDRELADSLGITGPQAEQFGRVVSGEPEYDPEATEAADPIDSLEPIRVGEEMMISAAFHQALAWCVGGKTLVEIGMRYLCVLKIWKPVLLAGMTLELEAEMQRDFIQNVGSFGAMEGLGRLLEWARRARMVSAVGLRIVAMAYVLSPGLIGDMTLEQMGEPVKKTRQAVDKLVQDFRDTFEGIRSRSMRDDGNRLICKNAQHRKRGENV